MAEATATAVMIDPSSGQRSGPEADRRRVSPAAQLADRFAAAEVTGPRGVSLRELAFLTMVGLRAVPGSAAVDRLQTRLGTPLPTGCGDVTTAGNAQVLWLSPDEFLVISSEPADELTAGLVEALQGEPGSATDLSANRTTFVLRGPSARSVLEKGCPLDLHPRAFAVGTAYLTLIGKIPVILWKIADEEFWILPRSSFADFLGRWLLDAMAEFQGPELP